MAILLTPQILKAILLLLQSDQQRQLGMERLESVVKKIDAGGELLAHRPLLGGISASMIAFDMRDSGGTIRHLVMRKAGARVLAESPEAVSYEFRVLGALKESTVSSPVPVLLDESGDIFKEPYMVLEYLDGCPKYDAGNSVAQKRDYVEKMAAALAALHALPCGGSEYSFLTVQKDRLEKKFSKRPEKLDPLLREPELRGIIENNLPLSGLNKPVLLHGDFWPGNVLWQGAEITGIIDWEDAELGDPLYEIAVTRFDLLWVFGRDAMEHFTETYKALMGADVDFGNLPFFELMSAIRPSLRISEWVDGWVDLGRDDVTEETFMECHKYYVDRALCELGF